MTLKNGRVAKDPRLGRIPQFDPQSKLFSVSKLFALVGQSPRSYTWDCPIVLDQGQEGSCVGHGIAHELAARPAPVRGMTHQFARERIYWEAQKIDEWAGGSYPGASPVYEGTSVLAGVKVAKKLGYFDRYHWALSFDDFVLGVGYQGPSVIGVNWWSGMFEPDAQGFLHRTGSIEGGHCILVVGVSINEQAFTVHNSWGESWGRRGRAKISFADMRALLSDEGEACFFDGRHTVPKVTR